MRPHLTGRMGSVAVEVRYVRFQSSVAESRGRYVGVFGLVNTLAKQGRLTAEQERFRRANNDWYDAAYPGRPWGQLRALGVDRPAGAGDLRGRVPDHRCPWLMS